MSSGKLLCEHEKNYIAQKGKRKVFNNNYTVSKRNVSVFAARLLKSPFLIHYDKQTRGSGSNKLYWKL